jgi:hypothetical protein
VECLERELIGDDHVVDSAARRIEGIIAKKLDDPYEPDRTRWWKILNPVYSQKEGRAERSSGGTREPACATALVMAEHKPKID